MNEKDLRTLLGINNLEGLDGFKEPSWLVQDRYYFQDLDGQFDDITVDCSRNVEDGYIGIVVKPPEAYFASHTSVNFADYGSGTTRPDRHSAISDFVHAPAS